MKTLYDILEDGELSTPSNTMGMGDPMMPSITDGKPGTEPYVTAKSEVEKPKRKRKRKCKDCDKSLKESLLDAEEDMINNSDAAIKHIEDIVYKYFNVYGGVKPIEIDLSKEIPIVNINGDICFNNKGIKLRHLPTEFKFGTCRYTFELSWGELETLEGCPEEVGDLLCDEMPRLKSLKGSPKIIYGNWQLTNCKNLKSLDCDTKEVKGVFDCHRCDKLPKDSTIKAKVKGKIRIDL